MTYLIVSAVIHILLFLSVLAICILTFRYYRAKPRIQKSSATPEPVKAPKSEKLDPPVDGVADMKSLSS